MWETAFDVSMLDSPKVIVSCPDEELAEVFMELLAEHGIKWCGIREAPSKCYTEWLDYKEDTCYWIEDSILTYGNKEYAEEQHRFRSYIKCTFFGDEPDFEISADGFDAIISAGG